MIFLNVRSSSRQPPPASRQCRCRSAVLCPYRCILNSAWVLTLSPHICALSPACNTFSGSSHLTLAITADFTFMACGYWVTLGKATPCHPYKIVFSFQDKRKIFFFLTFNRTQIILFLISDHLCHHESSLLRVSTYTRYALPATYMNILFSV